MAFPAPRAASVTPTSHRTSDRPPGDARRPPAVEQRAAGQLELGPEIVQMPLQRVVEPDALTNEAFAVINQQPQIQLGPVEMRGREGLQPFLQRDAGDAARVDRIRL